MKTTINKSYPSFLIVWITFWIFIDGCILLGYTAASSEQSFWTNQALVKNFWFDLAGIITSFIIGMILIFLSLQIDRNVKKSQIIPNPSNFLILGMVFFYFRNIISIAKFIVTVEPKWYLTSLVFTAVWLIPSIVISFFHYFFYKDTLDYNDKINLDNSKKSAQIL